MIIEYFYNYQIIMILQIIVNIFNHLMSKKIYNNLFDFFYSAFESYRRCNSIIELLKKSELARDSQNLSDFIKSANDNFVRKKKIMNILNNLSNKLKKDKIILKNSREKLSEQKEKEKEKIIQEKDELQFSLIKENSFDNSEIDNENEIMNINKNINNIEISVVHQDKLEEKQKNILIILELIKFCRLDVEYLDKQIKNYKNCSDDLIMKSEVFDDNKIVMINKREENEKNTNDLYSSAQKIEYYKDLQIEFVSLKKKLEELLALYKTEKEFTEIKKIELEKLEKVKNEYKILKKKANKLNN